MDAQLMRKRMPRLLLTALVAMVALALAPAEASLAGGGTAVTSGHASAGATKSGRPDHPSYLPKIRHVFVVNIENKGYDTTWGPDSPAPYLAKTLRRKGVLLSSYYATAHNSQPNYIAQISGQAPNPQMQSDCQSFSAFNQTGTQAPQQAVGTGCVFPKSVRSLPRQMSNHHQTWRGYMEQMSRPCQHPAVGDPDPTQHATAKHNYAVRHNPFVYFQNVISNAKYCKRHVVPLGALKKDLQRVKTTRRLTYITPDLCHDGHDAPCANGEPGGLASVNTWMKSWIPRILQSPAFKKNGVLIITADESDSPFSDSTACCNEQAGPNSPKPGITGPGGGHIGALVISRWTTPNTFSSTPYNHYSLLASIEEIFRLKKIGFARQAGLDRFGLDVYNDNWWES